MSAIRFARSCPNCSRMLEIGIDLIGRDFRCYHCNTEFVASIPHPVPESERLLDEKIDRLLDAADRHVARFSFSAPPNDVFLDSR